MGLSLRYVVLGVLVQRPGHRYEIKCRIDERMPMLGYSQQAVYPTIDRLHRKGLVQPVGTTIAGAGPESQVTIYGPTDEGVAIFERWMLTPTPPEKTRDELFAKLPIMRTCDVPHLLVMAGEQRKQVKADLREVRAAAALSVWSGSGPMPPHLVGAGLYQSHEARRLAAIIESLEEIRERLEQMVTGELPSEARSRAAPR